MNYNWGQVMWCHAWPSETISSWTTMTKFPLEGAANIWWHVYKRGQGIGREGNSHRLMRARPLSNPFGGSNQPINVHSTDHFWPVLRHCQEQRSLGSSIRYNNERDCQIMTVFSVVMNNINIVFTVFTALSWDLCFYSYIRLENLQKFFYIWGRSCLTRNSPNSGIMFLCTID